MAIVEKEIFSTVKQETKPVKKEEVKTVEVKTVEDNEKNTKKDKVKMIEGLVISTGPLNVRKEPNIESNPPVGVIPKGSIVNIDVNKSTVDWVYLESENIKGYSMKKFIKINK